LLRYLMINETALLEEFASSPDSLRVYWGGSLIYSSRKDGLLPLMEYLGTVARNYRAVTVFDRIAGNGAALLCVVAGVAAVYSPLGSILASRTLEEYNIKHYFSRVVPYIEGRRGQGMCPIEVASQGQSPESFCKVMQTRHAGKDAAGKEEFEN
jgi:hypothetical protein